jgi:hypothetical protein
MSYTREQLIEILTPALVKTTATTAREVRAVLETYGTEDLTVELARQRKAGYVPTPPSQSQQSVRAAKHQQPEIMGDQGLENLAWVHISRVRINGKMPVDNAANRKIVFGWLHPGEQPTVEWFKRVLAEQPGLADQISWEPVLSPSQRKQAEAAALARDRDIFSALCRDLSLSECEANFNVWRSTNSISGLAPARQEEIEKWHDEAAEERKDFLVNRATPDQLKAAARQESADKRAEEQTRQANEQFEAAKQRDQALGYPELPSDITKEQIRNASVERLKFWVKRFGNHQINLRLNGRG